MTSLIRRLFSNLTTLLLIFHVQSVPAYADKVTERIDLNAVFRDAGFSGAMSVYDVADNHLILVNKPRAIQPLVPASTFKIANSLIALEVGVVADENEMIPYGGKPQPVKAWQKNMSMRDALPISAVPIYQELARRIGLKKYADWLSKLNYGNRRTGTNVETFWLVGPLKISAVEQSKFNASLATGALNASSRSQRIVREILRLEQGDGYELFGKTGWDRKVGWWSGWVERDGRVYAFALNMDMPNITDAPKRIEIAKAILTKLKLYK